MNKTIALLAFCCLLSSVVAWWPKTASTNTDLQAQTTLNKVAGLLDANDIYSIEVNDLPMFNKTTTTFQAQLQDGMWKIRNQFDFPADLDTRLGTIIGAVINLKRGPLITADASRHADLRILDPRSRHTLHSKAYGHHIQLKNKNQELVLDLIFGRYDQELERSYVRFADDDQVYTSTAFLYLDADWRTWVKKPIFEHSYEQCTMLEFSAFADKPFREANTFSLNPKTFQWEFRSRPVNTNTLKEFSEYLLAINLEDALPLNQETWEKLTQYGIQFSNNQVSADIHHRIACRDKTIYDVYVSEVLSQDDSRLEMDEDNVPKKFAYIVLSITPGAQSSASYTYRCSRFAFMVDHSFLEVIAQIPNQLLQ